MWNSQTHRDLWLRAWGVVVFLDERGINSGVAFGLDLDIGFGYCI